MKKIIAIIEIDENLITKNNKKGLRRMALKEAVDAELYQENKPELKVLSWRFIDAKKLIEDEEMTLTGQIKSERYPNVTKKTASNEMYGFKKALNTLELINETELNDNQFEK